MSRHYTEWMKLNALFPTKESEFVSPNLSLQKTGSVQIQYSSEDKFFNIVTQIIKNSLKRVLI